MLIAGGRGADADGRCILICSLQVGRSRLQPSSLCMLGFLCGFGTDESASGKADLWLEGALSTHSIIARLILPFRCSRLSFNL